MEAVTGPCAWQTVQGQLSSPEWSFLCQKTPCRKLCFLKGGTKMNRRLKEEFKQKEAGGIGKEGQQVARAILGCADPGAARQPVQKATGL